MDANAKLAALQPNSPVKVFWEEARELMNDDMSKVLQKCAQCFAEQGVVFYGQLWDKVYEVVKETFVQEPWQIASEWADTIEMLGAPNQFKRRGSSITIEHREQSKQARGTHYKFLSPGKGFMLLGEKLQSEDRFHEIEAVFSQPEIFLDVYLSNPQVFRGKPLKKKATERITMIVCQVSAIKWGMLHYDKLFANVVAMCVRNQKLRQAAKTSTPGYERDLAKSVQYKASTLRNHPQSNPKNKFTVHSADYNDNVKKLESRGLQVVVVPNELSIFSPEYIESAKAQLQELKESVMEEVDEEQAETGSNFPLGGVAEPNFKPIPTGMFSPSRKLSKDLEDKDAATLHSWLIHEAGVDMEEKFNGMEANEKELAAAKKEQKEVKAGSSRSKAPAKKKAPAKQKAPATLAKRPRKRALIDDSSEDPVPSDSDEGKSKKRGPLASRKAPVTPARAPAAKGKKGARKKSAPKKNKKPKDSSSESDDDESDYESVYSKTEPEESEESDESDEEDLDAKVVCHPCVSHCISCMLFHTTVCHPVCFTLYFMHAVSHHRLPPSCFAVYFVHAVSHHHPPPLVFHSVFRACCFTPLSATLCVSRCISCMLFHTTVCHPVCFTLYFVHAVSRHHPPPCVFHTTFRACCFTPLSATLCVSRCISCMLFHTTINHPVCFTLHFVHVVSPFVSHPLSSLFCA